MHLNISFERLKCLFIMIFYLIRATAILSLVCVGIFFTACGVSTAEPQANKKIQKPLTDSQTISKAPKIIAFGDSLTAGFGLAEKESYPYLLQQKLKAEGYNYEVINAGVSGETSIGGLERIDWVLEMENVEILILELGANDLLRGLPVAKMKENLNMIIKKAKAKNVQVLLCGMLAPPNMGAKYQRDYVMTFPNLASEHKVAFLPFILEGIALESETQSRRRHPPKRRRRESVNRNGL
ncbi:MAG: arylesterase [Pyrinomonadaceae bacterium]